MKEYIKYIPLSLFVAFCLKSLTVGVELKESPLFAILAVFSAYLIHKEEEKEKKLTLARLDALEKQTETKSKEVEELRSHVSSIKLGQQIRSAVKF